MSSEQTMMKNVKSFLGMSMAQKLVFSGGGYNTCVYSARLNKLYHTTCIQLLLAPIADFKSPR